MKTSYYLLSLFLMNCVSCTPDNWSKMNDIPDPEKEEENSDTTTVFPKFDESLWAGDPR